MEGYLIHSKTKTNIFGAIHQLVFAPKSIYPLITFRILFGALMFFGTTRFMMNGWIEKLYIEPKYHFKFYGFEWVENLSTSGLYNVHYIILISSLFIAIGFLYRISIITFLLSFTYVELIDATNYLNHYYLVILLAFLLAFSPANAFCSIDAICFPRIKRVKIPAWCINIIIAQLCIVYFYAGLAKLNYDWLVRAMPLSIWLPEHIDIPLIGYFLKFGITAKLFSWFGAFYDLTIWIFLLVKKSRPIAYLFVIVFHLMTWMLFNIGLFPWIMIFSTLIFFSPEFHEKFYRKFIPKKEFYNQVIAKKNKYILTLIVPYILFQLLFPLRSYFYEGNVLWHEQGYRFSWRVMVVEKSGTATFFIKDKESRNSAEIYNTRYLTDFQEKQMCIQPDFILQFAKIIITDYENEYNEKIDLENTEITADVFVALNRRTSSRFINPTVNLLEINSSTPKEDWILPFKER